MHSDHGSQYSSKFVKNSSKIKYSISMGRIGNSLGDREVEYFFGCLKGEYLKRLKLEKCLLKNFINISSDTSNDIIQKEYKKDCIEKRQQVLALMQSKM
ncbi:Integrase catalytic domain-containing protein [Mycoplasma marinum]|uniref:Integrase catalytic domain-containing protein n=2 Tax=Mycoplasma marinum TaxID=1937190 RepID=A0A4R0XVK8_9MOLU|nr:hypothetical protein C4B24_03350 [Mycoplasma marinum]